MTAAALARLMCLASSIYGRPAWDDAKCAERADLVVEAARRHAVDPLLMLAVDVYECDMQDVDAPIYAGEGKKRRIVGYDACPMGVRVRGVEVRRRLGPRELYDRAAVLLAKAARRHRRGPRHPVAAYNPGNPAYADQVLAIRAALAGRTSPSSLVITPRTRDIVGRLRGVLWPGS